MCARAQVERSTITTTDYRMSSLTIECVLLQTAERSTISTTDYRMCSLTIECVLIQTAERSTIPTTHLETADLVGGVEGPYEVAHFIVREHILW